MALAALQPDVVLRIEGRQRAAQFALCPPQGTRVVEVAVRVSFPVSVCWCGVRVCWLVGQCLCAYGLAGWCARVRVSVGVSPDVWGFA